MLVSSVPEPTAPAVSTTGTVFALIAKGGKRLALGDRTYEYRAGEYLVASVDLPITGRFTEASLGFGLALRPSVIASLLLDAGPTRAATPSGIAVTGASPELLDAVVRMLRLLDRPDDAPVLAPMLEREIVWRLMNGEQGATVRALGLADSSLTHISSVIGWIRDHHAERFAVGDLAARAGMSVSAFHRSFRTVTAMSPIQFQKLIRLQEARLRLLAQPADVAGAGYAVGYDSPSQFSRDYRRQFGRPPGRDAARLRRVAAA